MRACVFVVNHNTTQVPLQSFMSVHQTVVVPPTVAIRLTQITQALKLLLTTVEEKG